MTLSTTAFTYVVNYRR